MYAGKLVFAQVMEFAPWHTFRRSVAKYRGGFNVRTFSCLDQFLCMAFGQPTYRESLRDIEACLGAQPAKLYHLGIRGNSTRSNPADANEGRDWRNPCGFAQALIRTIRRLYAQDPLAADLHNMVYVLAATTISLCHSVFSWAPIRKTMAAINLHTLFSLRGAIPAFIFISDGKYHDVNVLDLLLPRPGPSTSGIAPISTSSGCMSCTGPGPSSSPGPNRTSAGGACTPIRWLATPA